MELQLFKEDITLIGHTSYNQNGMLTIVCSINSARFEYLLLRGILKCFGESYKVTDTYEILKDERDLLSVSDRVFVTNLPYEQYSQFKFHWIVS